MLDYLHRTLGLTASEEPWPFAEQLPLYLRSGRTFSILNIDPIQLLVIRIDPAKFQLRTFLAQRQKLSKYWSGEIVLCFSTLTSMQRKSLIQHGLSFIVPNNQIYIPHLGMVLQERMASPQIRYSEKLTAMAQYLLLFLLYRQEQSTFTKIELATMLNLPAMTITRSVRELAELQFVTSIRKGRCDYVTLQGNKARLYERAYAYFTTPVQKRIFVESRPELQDLPLAGESALASISMLNPPSIPCKAIDRKLFRQLDDIQLLDPNWSLEKEYIELEIWNYNPCCISQDHHVDLISLALSLKDNPDERIEEALNSVMEENLWL